jgi:hypothetical protein
MTGKQLLKMFNDGKKITIRFTENIEDCELLYSKNMIAEILSIYRDDDCIILKN